MTSLPNPIKVCICIPRAMDARSADEQAATLAQFEALGAPIAFRFAEYAESQEIRVMRGHPQRAIEARSLAPPPTPELRAALAEANVILATDLPFDMDVLAPNLRWVQSVTAGVGQLLSAGLEKNGVLLTSGAGLAANPIAEFALARILAHWKHFALFDLAQREHRWSPRYGRTLAGCTLAVVGYGAIGEAVARRAHAWGMRVLATRRRLPQEAAPGVDRFYPVSEIKPMLAEADAVVVCVPESPETYRMFDAALFAAMKPGSFFCNVARGSVVDEAALREALASGRLGGAAIDVAEQEPLPPGSPLWDTPGLAISPHSAVSVDRYTHDLWALFLENMARFVAGRPLKNLVEAAPVTAG